MKVFITGGSGRIGSAVIPELLSNGHSVIALARSDASAEALESLGAQSLRGDLSDHDALRAGASMTDAVIHLAFSNDFSSAEALTRSIEEETAALLLFADELTGTGHPLVTVSGTPLAEGRASTEFDPLPLDGPVGGRGRTVTALMKRAEDGLHSIAIRLPRTVHSDADGGFAGLLAAIARQSRVSGYPGDGTQRWPAVHAADAAVLFRLALEGAGAGTSWHAVQDEGDAVRDIAEVIGRRLGVPVTELPVESFGQLGAIFAADQPASSAYTRATLGWEPTQLNLLEDFENLEP